MLRIAIVDDEILIREGLARMISKESAEFLVIGTYSDGKHLLDELTTLQLDVVITDIRMPQINGLELIKQLKATHPQIYSILMSGFVEFNYAREAIRSSAVDYLLKPINKEATVRAAISARQRTVPRATRKNATVPGFY